MARHAFRADWRDNLFFSRLLATDVFKNLAGIKEGSIPPAPVAKDAAMSVLKTVLRSGGDETVRRTCLEAAGRVCCDVFMERFGLRADTDIDTFLENLADVWDGHREVWREGDLVYDDFAPALRDRSLDGECGCPLREIPAEDPTALCKICASMCQKAMYEAVVGHPVQVQLLRSPLCTGTFSCRWLIDLKPSP